MTNTNEINKIYIDETVKVINTPMTSLLFVDKKIISKKHYSIADSQINLIYPGENDLTCYFTSKNSNYYEFNITFRKDTPVILNTKDVFGNIIPRLGNTKCLVFVNGLFLYPEEYEITLSGELQILNSPVIGAPTTVCVFCSADISFIGEYSKGDLLKNNEYQLNLYNYSINNYIFFKNREIILPTNISIGRKQAVILNEDLVETETKTDKVFCYRMPSNTECFFFDMDPGYTSYGPLDYYDKKVPVVFDLVLEFPYSVKYIIDDLRKGFFIKNNDGAGAAIVVDEVFNKNFIRCLKIESFSQNYFAPNQLFAQVPQARSILHYLSEFDLENKLFPEILGTFQRILLDETYDSIQRIKNIRSMTNVDSAHIGYLLDFLGLKIDTTNKTLEQKHGILEELCNFYNRAGTRASYNFYNLMTIDSKLLKLEQLFTPIKKINHSSDRLFDDRYVTFKTAEELGAVYKKEFQLPLTDYGYVNELANTSDTFLNTNAETIRSEGILEDEDRPYIPENRRRVYFINEDGESDSKLMEVTPNPYTTPPVMGPNQPTIDYGSIEIPDVNSYDYGYVDDPIAGQWVTWFEWERDKNWYPTNHVQLSAQIPPEISYDQFLEEFKRIFYDISSTVVYIHQLVEIYVFGGGTGEGDGSGTGGGSGGSGGGQGGTGASDAGYFAVNICGGPIYSLQEFVFTNDPERQVAL